MNWGLIPAAAATIGYLIALLAAARAHRPPARHRKER
jgi:hypothetical protein